MLDYIKGSYFSIVEANLLTENQLYARESSNTLYKYRLYLSSDTNTFFWARENNKLVRLFSLVPGNNQKFVTTVLLGGSIGWVTITHNLGTEDFVYSLFRLSDKKAVFNDIKIIDSNSVQLRAIGTNTNYKLVIMT